MTQATPLGRSRVRPRDTDANPVFLNPSGTRWKYLRAVLLTLLLACAAFVGVAVPNVLHPPALDGAGVPAGPTAAEVGEPPLIGTGPLVRVVRLLSQDGAVYAQDPFDGMVVAQLSPEDAERAGGARYALQKYGYSAAAHRTISLTFDDGPDPQWTPQLLDLLSRHHVPATFFITGEQTVKHREIVDRLVREGFAVGNHSLTHTDVNSATSFRQQVELAMTDRMMRAQTGHFSSYFRLPYESDDPEAMQEDLPGIMRAQQLGYVVASHDFDSLDWAHADHEVSGAIPLPPFGEQDNITVLLHDGGGDRGMTLGYVERVIRAAEAAGYTFQSMPQVHPDIQARTGTVDPSIWDEVALRASYALFALPGTMLNALFVLALVTMLGLGLFNTLLALIRARRGRGPATTETPGVSVLIAAFNEELVITRTLQYVLGSTYPIREVVVVDDGSTDGTAAMVRAVAAEDARVRLVQQPNAGKWAALNRGLETVDQPFVVTLDADTLFTPETIGELMSRFHSPRVGAVAGVIKVGNYSRNIVTRWQALEYLTQIGVERAAGAFLNAVMVIPGACAAWRTAAVREVGGYSDATLAEDCDLTLMLHQHGWQVEQADGAVAHTEAPETVDALLRQRVRWMYGTLQAIWRHRNMLLRPRYGWLGMLVMPMSVLTVVVPLLFTPVITLLLLQMLASEGPLPLLLYFGIFALVYGTFAAVAIRLMGERASHLLMVPLYRVIYEPLRAYLLYASLGTALRGVRLGWGKLARTAHMDDEATAWQPNVVAQPHVVAQPNVVGEPTAVHA
jgi:biofilm PGA synthesis N-glycosyltransferase PgaC